MTRIRWSLFRRLFALGGGLALAVGLLTGAHAQGVAPGVGVGPVTTVATFAPPQLPEGLAIDAQGRLYVGMAVSGEILRMAPDGSQRTTLATFRKGMGFLAGLALDPATTATALYAMVASNNAPDTDTHGVWRVGPDGARTLVAALPPEGLPNAVVFHRNGDLLVSDTLLGAIWRVTRAGQVTSWAQHPLLTGDLAACPGLPVPGPFGANGLAFNRRGDLFVANTTKGLIARVPVNADGSAGTPTVFAGPDCATLGGADGLAMDAQDTLYVGVNPQNRLVRVDALGRVQTLATAAQGLDGPASLAFGTTPGTQRDLYITNFSIVPFLSGGTPRPALVRVVAGPAGLPRTGSANAQSPAVHSWDAVLGPWSVLVPTLSSGALVLTTVWVVARRRSVGVAVDAARLPRRT